MKDFCLFLVLIFVMFFSVACSAQETNDKAYTATTVDECIEEKECVWYALEKLIGLKDVERQVQLLEPSRDVYVHRLVDDVRISVLGDYAEEDISRLKKLSNSISSYIPYNVELGSPYTHIVVFSRSFSEDIQYNYRKSFQDVFGSDIVYESYANSQGHDDDCFSVGFYGDKETTSLVAFLSFVKINAEKDLCLKSQLFHLIGYQGTLDDFEFSFFNGKYADFTKVDLFLAYFLYSDLGARINSDMNIRGIKSIFDIAYAHVLENFLVLYKENKNVH